MTTDSERDRPFLSVILRSAGQPAERAEDTLLSLAAQTSPDFEVLVVLEEPAAPEDYRVLVASFDNMFADRVRLMSAAGSPAGALAGGAARAQGRYVATMDVPDVAFGNWVETFQGAAVEARGKVLYSMAAVQPFEVLQLGSGVAYVSTGRPLRPWPAHFDIMDFLQRRGEASGTLGLALPTSVVCTAARSLAFQPQPVGDWGTSLWSCLLAGVADTGEVTYLRRKLPNQDPAPPAPSEDEWQRARLDLQRNLEPHTVSVPAWVLSELLDRREEVEHLLGRVEVLQEERARTEQALDERDRRIEELLRSTSWRLSKPIRTAGAMVRAHLRPT